MNPDQHRSTPPISLKKKSTKTFIILIVAPFVLLFSIIILQLIVQFSFDKVETTDTTVCTKSDFNSANACVLEDDLDTTSASIPRLIFEISQTLLGIVAIVLLLLEPLWIILLVLAVGYNNTHFPKSTA